MSATTTIWSVGHSTHAMPAFLELLQDEGIQVVADVRSQPFSRFSPQFNRREFRSALRAAGLDYVFLGEELGGRPPEQELYDEDGHVLYGELAKTPRFQTGLRRLIEGAEQFRVAMLCSEEDPTHCHRRLLITRVLCGEEVSVLHIRGDQTTIAERDLQAAEHLETQAMLFGEERTWRSTRSVSPSTPQKSSSRS